MAGRRFEGLGDLLLRVPQALQFDRGALRERKPGEAVGDHSFKFAVEQRLKWLVHPAVLDLEPARVVRTSAIEAEMPAIAAVVVEAGMSHRLEQEFGAVEIEVVDVAFADQAADAVVNDVVGPAIDP